MKSLRTMAFAAAVGVAGVGDANAGATADVNRRVCESMSKSDNMWGIIELERKAQCECVGNHSELMARLRPELSNTDHILKAYHQCLDQRQLTNYYSRIAWAGLSKQLSSDVMSNYGDCFSNNAFIEGVSFGTDARSYDQMFHTAQKKCQWIIDVNSTVDVLRFLFK